jgi:hypothetical protein
MADYRDSLGDLHGGLKSKGGYKTEEYDSLNELKEMLNSMNEVRNESYCPEHTDFSMPVENYGNEVNTNTVFKRLPNIKSLCSSEQLYTCDCNNNITCECHTRTLTCDKVTNPQVSAICSSRTTYSVDTVCSSRTNYVPDVTCLARTTYRDDSIYGNESDCLCNDRSGYTYTPIITCQSRVTNTMDSVTSYVKYPNSDCPSELVEVCTCDSRIQIDKEAPKGCECNADEILTYVGCSCENRTVVTCSCNSRSTATESCECNNRTARITDCACNSRVTKVFSCSCVDRTTNFGCYCNSRSTSECESRVSCACQSVCTCDGGVSIFNK